MCCVSAIGGDRFPRHFTQLRSCVSTNLCCYTWLREPCSLGAPGIPRGVTGGLRAFRRRFQLANSTAMFGSLFTPALAERLATRPVPPVDPPAESGEAHAHVGVRDMVTDSGLRFRLYYPGRPSSSARPAGWFVESFGETLKGHMHVMSPFKAGTWSFALSAPLLKLVANVVSPLAWATLPGAFVDLEPAVHASGRPLVVFSHGLTGTGEEHATLFCAWARAGAVVACVHHTDGSSSRAVRPDGSEIYYDLPPGMNGRPGTYPPEFRTEQIERRERELSELRDHVLHSDAFDGALRAAIDPSRVLVGGFSYGAATAALSATKNPERYKAALLLDGWFNVDLASIEGCPSDEQVAFPPLSHERGVPVPALFVGSSEFAGYHALNKRTQSLAKKCAEGTEVHTLPQTLHWSFMDVVCWLGPLAPRLYAKGGAPEPHRSYEALFDITTSFLSKASRL